MHESPRHVAPFIARLATAIAALLVMGLVVLMPTRPAAAASIGPGWGPEDNDGLGFVGAFVVDGQQMYCLEPQREAPLGETSPLGFGGWGSASPDDLARANWAIGTMGQSADPRDTVAVNLYVWSLLAPTAYNGHGVPGDVWYAEYVPSAADRAGMLARLATLRVGGAAITATAGSGSGALAITIDPVDDYRGSVVVSGVVPAAATGVLVLDHAVFDATGTSSIGSVTSGAVLAFTAMPPDGPAPYRVGVDGSFTATTWRGEVDLWSTADAQTIAGPGRSDGLAFPLSGADARDREVLFQPVVTTDVVAGRVEPGGRFADVLRFSLAPDANGRVNRWYRTAAGYLPVTASCRVYGPLDRPPAPDAAPPPGAALASSFVVTTGPGGPDGEYVVESEHPLIGAGWYAAQCSIDARSQLAATRPYLPDGYRSEDQFGLAEETVLVPFLPSVSTAFSASVAAAGASVIDAVTIAVVDGPWPLDAVGARIPIELEGRFTLVDTAPVRSAAPPPAAEEIDVQRITVTAAGTVRAEPVRIPDGARWLVAQWCVVAGPAVLPVCDDWGVPGEVVEVRTAPTPGPTPTPTPTPTALPKLAITGEGGTPPAAWAGLAAACVAAGILLRLAVGLSGRSRRNRTQGVRRSGAGR
jgi:hypothetical protein